MDSGIDMTLPENTSCRTSTNGRIVMAAVFVRQSAEINSATISEAYRIRKMVIAKSRTNDPVISACPVYRIPASRSITSMIPVSARHTRS